MGDGLWLPFPLGMFFSLEREDGHCVQHWHDNARVARQSEEGRAALSATHCSFLTHHSKREAAPKNGVGRNPSVEERELCGSCEREGIATRSWACSPANALHSLEEP